MGVVAGEGEVELADGGRGWVRWFVLQAEYCLRCWVLVVCHQNPDVLVSDDR